MKQQNLRRSRNRGNGRRPNYHGHARNSTIESSGPDGKVRGSAHQVIEKYQALARDALSSGDRIAAENFFQHAEHYLRVAAANGGGDQRAGNRRPNRPTQESDEGAEGEATSEADGSQNQVKEEAAAAAAEEAGDDRAQA